MRKKVEKKVVEVNAKAESEQPPSTGLFAEMLFQRLPVFL